MFTQITFEARKVGGVGLRQISILDILPDWLDGRTEFDAVRYAKLGVEENARHTAACSQHLSSQGQRRIGPAPNIRMKSLRVDTLAQDQSTLREAGRIISFQAFMTSPRSEF